MAKKSIVTKANSLYCSQLLVSHEKKLMLLFVEDKPVAVIRKKNEFSNVELWFDEKVYIIDHYDTEEVELRTCASDMRSSFRLYTSLRDCVPNLRVTNDLYKRCLYEYFTHTQVGARRHGGFKMVTDYHQYDGTFSAAEELLDSCEDVELAGGRYHREFPDTRQCYFGTGYHVGDGAYCDDDGDNWDFF